MDNGGWTGNVREVELYEAQRQQFHPESFLSQRKPKERIDILPLIYDYVWLY